MRKPAMYKMLDIPKNKVTDMIKLLQGECGLDEVMYHDRFGVAPGLCLQKDIAVHMNS